jgi:transcriptional antiterminator NusG
MQRAIDNYRGIGYCGTFQSFEGSFFQASEQGMTPQDQGRKIEEATYPWFAIRVRSKHEQVTAVHLRHRGYEEFSPSYKIERQWSDRRKIGEQFLFPGYVFCRFNPQQRLPVLTAPGVVGLVGFGDGPTPIPDNEIEQVRAMVRSGLLVTPWPFLEKGQIVLIERGPLAGIEGILEKVKGRFRLVVSIRLLQRSVSSEVDRTWVRPLRPPRPQTDLKGNSGAVATKSALSRGPSLQAR